MHELGAVIFGERAPRIPNTTYFAFPHIDGETLVVELDKLGYAVAAGAACSSASTEPSATLLAMGVEPELARGRGALEPRRDQHCGRDRWFSADAGQRGETFERAQCDGGVIAVSTDRP